MTISPPDLRIRRDADEIALADWRRRRRRRLLLKITIPLLALVLIAAGVWAVGFSTLLAVQSVSVSGAKLVGQDAVRQTAAVPVGAPLARVDLSAIHDRVAGIRQIESVSVERQWPHTVDIKVVERTPVYVAREGGSYLLVDRYGVGYQTVDNAPAKLPQVEVDPGNRQLLKSLAVVAAALPDDLARKVDRIEAPTRDSIQLKLRNGDTVFWGSEEQSDLKAQVIVALLKQPGSHYDVSAPGNPAVR
ncbi:FtsQ-type POTRA domain-containing protein [Microlunatus elymi]|uniref:FtsQ-type POTRA domain-containing protein n=1 Tax=Microlunatus elymi TaxID=2596828 RepID=A0A516Q2C6_9ACTN|nr:FtsQ-type POTRA domain-containing protein [Microlunatus elymi]QDP97587.1 FtsQ-type POTRA domain-containing protein [Microlunatus elymi]